MTSPSVVLLVLYMTKQHLLAVQELNHELFFFGMGTYVHICAYAMKNNLILYQCTTH